MGDLHRRMRVEVSLVVHLDEHVHHRPVQHLVPVKHDCLSIKRSAMAEVERYLAVHRLLAAEVVRKVIALIEMLLDHGVVEGGAIHVDPPHRIAVQ